MTPLLLLAALVSAAPQQTTEYPLALPQGGEVIASIEASCERCDWGVPGREAVLLELSIDGAYSQHVALTRGGAATYRVTLGPLSAGSHRLQVRRDAGRSARDAGDARIVGVTWEVFTSSSPEYAWVSRAPLLRARPGTVEKFSDFPLVMYAEHDIMGESGTPYQFQYTVIFTNEDGGTPTDRLMATWGRTTDIEFIYGLTKSTPAREEIQADGHKWITFNGPRRGSHPVVWVSTENNMVADHGPEDMITFAPAPAMVALGHESREMVMDAQPWTYAVTSAEMVREGRIDPNGQPGSGKIPDPRRYATLEGCGQVADATLAFDIGVRRGGGEMAWYPTDRGDSRFRIARGGCFRGGTPLPEGVTPADIAGLRIRAYTRPPREGEAPLPRGTGKVTLLRVNRIFMLDEHFVPKDSPVTWTGSLAVKTDAAPVDVPVVRR